MNEFQAVLLREEARERFGSASLLGEAAFDEVGRAHVFPESPGQVKVSQESIRILGDNLHRLGYSLLNLDRNAFTTFCPASRSGTSRIINRNGLMSAHRDCGTFEAKFRIHSCS